MVSWVLIFIIAVHFFLFLHVICKVQRAVPQLCPLLYCTPYSVSHLGVPCSLPLLLLFTLPHFTLCSSLSSPLLPSPLFLLSNLHWSVLLATLLFFSHLSSHLHFFPCFTVFCLSLLLVPLFFLYSLTISCTLHCLGPSVSHSHIPQSSCCSLLSTTFLLSFALGTPFVPLL